MSGAGFTRIEPGRDYPPQGHPGGRQFRWDTGRVLPVMQMIAIRSGKGIVEWQEGKRQVKDGTVFFLLPGEWHRYRPDRTTGWIEQWIELRGPLLDRWISSGLFRDRIFALKRPGSFFETFEELHRRASGRRRHGGSHDSGQMLGLTILLLSHVVGGREAESAIRSSTRAERLVERAGEALREGMGVTATARALGISYPTLHRYFVEVRGISPKRAALQVRRARAETLLAEGQLSIKEIAAALGYHSSSHFSLAFKREHGVSPKCWREKSA